MITESSVSVIFSVLLQYGQLMVEEGITGVI